MVGAIEAGGGDRRGSFRRTRGIFEPGGVSASASRAFLRRVATSGTILGDTCNTYTVIEGDVQNVRGTDAT